MEPVVQVAKKFVLLRKYFSFVFLFSLIFYSDSSAVHNFNKSSSWNWRLVLAKTAGKENKSNIESPSRASAATWTDPEGNLWLFGGVDGNLSSPTYHNDLWKFDQVTESFSYVQTESSKPKPRKNSCMCGVGSLLLVIFGGQDSKNYFLNETWLFDVKDLKWIQLYAPSIHTPIVKSATACWCLSRSLVVFDGLSQDTNADSGIWEFSLENLTWKHVKFLDDKVDGIPHVRGYPLTWSHDDSLFLSRGCFHDCNHESKDNIFWKYSHSTRQWSTIYKQATSMYFGPCVSTFVDNKGNLWLFSGLKGDLLVLNQQTQSLHRESIDDLARNSTAYSQNAAGPKNICDQMSWHYKNVTYIFGGQSDGKYVGSMWILSPPQSVVDNLPVLDIRNTKLFSPVVIFIITMSATFSVACAFSMMFCLKRMLESPPGPAFASNVKYSPVAVEDEAIEFN